MINQWNFLIMCKCHDPDNIRNEVMFDKFPHDFKCFLFDMISTAWSAVAQLVECQTRNRESPGSNPRCYRFEVWAFSFTSRRLSRLSCINEYLAIDSGGNVSE